MEWAGRAQTEPEQGTQHGIGSILKRTQPGIRGQTRVSVQSQLSEPGAVQLTALSLLPRFPQAL